MSVVIPTYNRAGTLGATLDGLQRQSVRAFEVIVVVGPCTDDTLDVLTRYPAARIVHCPVARVGLARNLGIAASHGEIVAFIDDDAVPGATWLAQLVACYADPAVGAAGGFVWDVAHDRMQWSICTCTRAGEPRTDSPGPPESYLGAGADPFLYLAGCNMSLRRSVLEDCGGFNEALQATYDDVDVCRHVVDAGLKIALLPEAVVAHSYALNPARDASGTIRDPYRNVHSYATYISHNLPPGYEPAHLVEAHAVNWRHLGRQQAADGLLSPEELDVFLRRVEEGAQDGLRTGAEPRPRREFPAPDAGAFRAYGHAATAKVA